MGPWVRYRVNQVGGMGMIARLNRTFTYDVVFRHEVTLSRDLKALAPRFQNWYSQDRWHSRLEDQTPWQPFLADAAVLTEGIEGFLGHYLAYYNDHYLCSVLGYKSPRQFEREHQ